MSDWLLVASARIAALYTVVLLAALLLRSRGPRFQARLWRAALVGFVALTLIPPEQLGASPLPAIPNAVAAAAPAPSPAAHVPVPPVADTEPVSRGALPDVRALLMVLWGIGLAAALARTAAGVGAILVRVRRGERVADPGWASDLAAVRELAGVASRIELRVTPWTGAPALCGWIRPVVLLPASALRWPAERRRAVLTHELMHWKHGDSWFAGLAAVLKSVYWFHPAVWHAARQGARFQEQRCDTDVLDAGVDRVDYAAELVALARAGASRSLEPALPFVRRSQLEERVRTVLHAGRGRPAGRLAPVAVLLALAGSAAAIGHASSKPGALAGGSPHVVALPAGLERLRLDLTAHVFVRPTEDAPRLELSSGAVADRLRVDADGSTLTIADPGRSAARAAPVRLYLREPLDLELDLGLGNVECAAPLRSLSAVTGRGDLTLAADTIPGSVHLKTGRGAVDARLGRVGGGMDAESGWGDVEVSLRRSSDPETLRLWTGYGDVVLHTPGDPVRPAGSALFAGRGTVRVSALDWNVSTD